jgi:hypothetical protein
VEARSDSNRLPCSGSRRGKTSSSPLQVGTLPWCRWLCSAIPS